MDDVLAMHVGQRTGNVQPNLEQMLLQQQQAGCPTTMTPRDSSVNWVGSQTKGSFNLQLQEDHSQLMSHQARVNHMLHRGPV